MDDGKVFHCFAVDPAILARDQQNAFRPTPRPFRVATGLEKAERSRAR
jgi:hypothetical protein